MENNIKSNPRVAVMVMTYNAENHINQCMLPILNEKTVDEVVVVNSSGTDKTVELSTKLGCRIIKVPRKEFNHGFTKEYARRHIRCDILVCMSPDGYGNKGFIDRLVNDIKSDGVWMSYSRQIPHAGANIFESLPRIFNYPNKSEIRNLKTWQKEGPSAIFCSNTCAAYLTQGLNKIGGFDTVLTGEDTVAAAKILLQGGAIKYNSESVINHSHKYTLLQEFRRHFDAGYMRNFSRPEILMKFGSDNKKGKMFTQFFIKEVAKNNIFMLPYALLNILFKYFGYQVGKHANLLPKRMVVKLSSQDFYWSSRFSK